MARTTVNVVGNALASVVVARWEGVFGAKEAPPAPAQEAQVVEPAPLAAR